MGDDRAFEPAAIAFDLYGTLLDVGALIDACPVGLAQVDAAKLVALWRRTQLEYSWQRALMGDYADFWVVTADALDRAAALLRVPLEHGERARLMDAWLTLRPFPDVGAALERLPHPLAIVSNGSPRMLEEALQASGLAGRFACVLSVDRVKTYKPAPAVYAMAEREIGVPRASVVFVSANGWDVAGARTFGFRAAWVNRTGEPPERSGAPPHYTVSELAALAEMWVPV